MPATFTFTGAAAAAAAAAAFSTAVRIFSSNKEVYKFRKVLKREGAKQTTCEKTTGFDLGQLVCSDPYNSAIAILVHDFHNLARGRFDLFLDAGRDGEVRQWHLYAVEVCAEVRAGHRAAEAQNELVALPAAGRAAPPALRVAATRRVALTTLMVGSSELLQKGN